MNNQRRKVLRKALDLIENIAGDISSDNVENLNEELISKLLDKKSEAITIIEGARDEEQEYIDNMPESLQGGDKASAAEDAVSNLEDALSSLESADLEFKSDTKDEEELGEEKVSFFEEANTNIESAVDSLNSAIDG